MSFLPETYHRPDNPLCIVEYYKKKLLLPNKKNIFTVPSTVISSKDFLKYKYK